MGKKQHQKDRLFLTAKEWKEEWGGHREKRQLPFQRLPFHCCAISFTSFEDPVCTDDGTVFDVTNIVPYITKHHTHPVTGMPLELSELTPLTFHKNADGEYECPILKKVFTQVCNRGLPPSVHCCALHVHCHSWFKILHSGMGAPPRLACASSLARQSTAAVSRTHERAC